MIQHPTDLPEIRRIPAAVRHGLIGHADYDKLMDGLLSERVEKQQDGVARATVLCEDNVLLFAHIFLGKDVVPFMINVDREVRGRDNVVVMLPRSHSKSETYAIADTVHDVCYAILPDSKYRDPRELIVQETADAATLTMNAVRNTIDSGGQGRLIDAAFHGPKGETLHELSTTWAGDKIVIPAAGSIGKNPTILAIGVGGALQGLHPKKTKLDDIVTPKNSRTQHLRNVQYEWCQNTLFGTLDPGATVWSLCTPQYEDDTNDRLAKGGFYVVKRPALSRFPTMGSEEAQGDFEEILNESGERTWVTMTEKGRSLEALWPCLLGTGNCPGTKEHYVEWGVHRSVEWLLHEKYLRDAVSFTTQQMLFFVPPSQQRVTKEMLRFWSSDAALVGKPSEYNSVSIVPPPKPDDVVMEIHAWDHAIGKKRRHDRTAVAMLVRTRDKKVYARVRASRWDFPEVCKMMESLYRHPWIRQPANVVTEGIGFQEAYAQQVHQQSKEILPLLVEKGQADKDTALVESGLLQAMMRGEFLLEYEDKDTIQEFLMFTAEGRFHDDRADACRLGFNRIKAAVRREVKVHRRERRAQ